MKYLKLDARHPECHGLARALVDYPGYSVSETGVVIGKRVLEVKQAPDKRGYPKVCIWVGGKAKRVFVHRLVALAWVPNPNPGELTQVNHIDEVKTNNHKSNLEWCDSKQNNNHGTRKERVAEKTRKPVMCCNTGKVYRSIAQAASTLCLDSSSLSAHLRGKRKSVGGLTFIRVTLDLDNLPKGAEVVE